jgi:hypothetical protein
MWIWTMVLGGTAWLLDEVDLALNSLPIPISIIVVLIGLCSYLLVFPAVGAYVGYRTRAPGWLTGGLPVLILGVGTLLFAWFVTKAVDWGTIPFYLVGVVLGMAGGWIGGRLRKRRLAKAQDADEAAGSEAALGHMGDGLEGKSS